MQFFSLFKVIRYCGIEKIEDVISTENKIIRLIMLDIIH